MHSQLHHGGASMICGSVDALFGFKWICRTFIITSSYSNQNSKKHRITVKIRGMWIVKFDKCIYGKWESKAKKSVCLEIRPAEFGAAKRCDSGT